MSDAPGPTTGVREAALRRDHLCDAIRTLIKEYEKQVPGVRVSGVSISRQEIRTRIGTRVSGPNVTVNVVIE